MANAPLSISQAADLVDLSIQKVFEKSSEPPVNYPKYFKVRKTEDYYEKDSSLSGLGEADFVDENGVIVSDVPVKSCAALKSFLIYGETLAVGYALQAA